MRYVKSALMFTGGAIVGAILMVMWLDEELDMRDRRISGHEKEYRMTPERGPMSVPRGYLLGRRQWFPLDGRLHHAWWEFTDKAPWWLPMWLWRPLCWIDGGHECNGYGSCVRCWRSLP